MANGEMEETLDNTNVSSKERQIEEMTALLGAAVVAC